MKWIKKVAVTVLDNIAGAIIDSTNIADEITNTYSARIIKQLIEDSSNNTDIILKTIDLIYPVGRGFIDFTDTDYSNWLGLTWERELVGMTPIGKNENDADFATVGQKGGEKTHTLTVDEMPAHNHDFAYYDANQSQSTSKDAFSNPAWTNKWRGISASVINKGGSQPHNIMQPYQVVSYWKRVDPNAKTMISFTMWGITYQAEEGMTFAEWVPSEYNTDGWYYPSENSLALINPRGNIIDYADISASAKPTDIIEDGKTYSTYTEK